MEKSFNQEQEKLFDLLDQKNFHELTHSEKEFVLTMISQDEYEKRRTAIVGSKHAFESDVIPMAKPLMLPVNGNVHSHKKELILYRVLLSAAAVIILFLLVVPYVNDNTSTTAENTLVQRDTLTIEKEIHDTVYIEKLVTQKVKEKVYVQATTYETCSPEELRLLETGPVRPISIDAVLTEKNGKSMKDDETKFLVNDVNIVSDVIGR